MNETGKVVTGALAPPDPHPERVEREIRIEARGDLPAPCVSGLGESTGS